MTSQTFVRAKTFTMFPLIAICAISLLAAGVRAQNRVVTGGNDLFDLIAEQLRESDAVKVLPLDDMRFGFEKKIGPIVFHGEAKLHDGVVTGLDTIQRIGNASVDIFDDTSVKIKCGLGMGAVEFTYRGTVTFMDFGPSIKMNSHTGYITVDAQLDRDVFGGVKVRNFKIREFEQLQVKFSGLGPITWVGNLLIAPVVRLLSPVIKKVVEITVRGVIETKLPAMLDGVDLNLE